MSHEVNIHAAQTSILRELLFHPSAGFAELQKPTGLASDHFTFHVNRLLELGFVERVARGRYRLTSKGKEYANRLDTDNNTVERQPKSAVLLAVERKAANGEREFIFHQRLKHPFYGFYGLPSGKIRWGETIVECAKRELMEEIGIEADFVVKGVYHEHVYQQETGESLEDKLFFVVHGTNPRGTMVDDWEGGHNAWMTRTQAKAQPKVYDSFEIELDIIDGMGPFVEKRFDYSKDLF